MKKGQSWSVDIILAVIVFMAAFFIFYGIINSDPEIKITTLKQEASVVIEQVSSEDNEIGIIDGNEVNESKLNELKNRTYEELVSDLQIDGDFCIFFEDENGNIIQINNSYLGIGSENINISGVPCSQK